MDIGGDSEMYDDYDVEDSSHRQEITRDSASPFVFRNVASSAACSGCALLRNRIDALERRMMAIEEQTRGRMTSNVNVEVDAEVRAVATSDWLPSISNTLNC